MMFDVNQVVADAEKDLADEQAGQAKTKIKGKLREIAAAKAVVANLEREYGVLLRTIGSTEE